MYIALDGLVRILSTRTGIKELYQFLDQSVNSHEAAIENLQQSLMAREIEELNELLKWVLFAHWRVTLDHLEAVMVSASFMSILMMANVGDSGYTREYHLPHR